MALKLYNTLTRKTEEFKSITEGFAGFYGCGPTVYNYAHIGNLRAYVFLDTLDRALTFLGYKKKHVMNITDIGHLTGDGDDGEDKMLRTARERHESVLDVAKFYTQAFFKDIDALGIIRPDVVCKATEHIDDMINLIRRIEANGHTYMAGGNLYYDVSTFADYGALMGRRPQGSGEYNGMYNGVAKSNNYGRVEADTNKRNPCDFVLWFTKSKFSGQALTWESPWGRGYPGWHIECSAMSMKYLGEHFDIHTGGIDHIPIHHTNEIAQSEGATGKKWVNYWLHNEFLVIGKDKMSKSAGNFLTLQSLLDMEYEAFDYRYFLLGGHYRSQLYFSTEAMDSAKNSLKALVKRIAALMRQSGDDKSGAEGVARPSPQGGISPRSNLALQEACIALQSSPTIEAFRAAIEDDLNTPKALAALQVMLKDDGIPPKERLEAMRLMDSVLGLQLEAAARKVLDGDDGVRISSADGGTNNSTEDAEIAALVSERTEAKKRKDFASADRIRAALAARGVILTDTKDGTVWKRQGIGSDGRQ